MNMEKAKIKLTLKKCKFCNCWFYNSHRIKYCSKTCYKKIRNEQSKQTQKHIRENDRDNYNRKRRLYYKNNKTTIRNRAKKYYERDSGNVIKLAKRKEHAAKYRKDNKEKIKTYMKKWKSELKGKNPILVRAITMFSSVLSSGREHDIDKNWILEKLNGQHSCPICNVRFVFDTEIETTINPFKNMCKPSLDRWDSSKGYTKDNIVLLCLKCNSIKNQYTLEDFEKFIVGFRRVSAERLKREESM